MKILGRIANCVTLVAAIATVSFLGFNGIANAQEISVEAFEENPFTETTYGGVSFRTTAGPTVRGSTIGAAISPTATAARSSTRGQTVSCHIPCSSYITCDDSRSDPSG